MKKLLLLLLFSALCLTSCAKVGDKTPLGWCLWEIRKHEGYQDAYVYTYEEPHYPIDEEYTGNNSINVYIITTYTDELRTEWFCFIEYKNTIKKYLNENDIYLIDCDVVWEINYEEWGKEY